MSHPLRPRLETAVAFAPKRFRANPHHAQVTQIRIRSIWEGARAENLRLQPYLAALLDCVSALGLADAPWFDVKTSPGIACWACDCGDAGDPTNADGHDSDCVVSAAHALLARIASAEGER